MCGIGAFDLKVAFFLLFSSLQFVISFRCLFVSSPFCFCSLLFFFFFCVKIERACTQKQISFFFYLLLSCLVLFPTETRFVVFFFFFSHQDKTNETNKQTQQQTKDEHIYRVLFLIDVCFVSFAYLFVLDN